MKFDDVKKLTQKKYRDAFGYFLLEGEHLALELEKAFGANPLLCESELYVTSTYEHWRSPFKTHVISERQMAQITTTKTPPGIVAVVPMLPSAAQPQGGERTLYLYEIQDPGNLGTILRTLAWFGGWRCLLSPNSVDPYNEKCVRASMGAIFHVPLELDVALEALPARFSRIACLDLRGTGIREEGFKARDCYVFGSEARGLPHATIAEMPVETFTIQGKGPIESLNLAAAVNMCVYELCR